MKTFLVCITAGLCIAASVPPWGWWPLIFVGVALLDRLLIGTTAKQRFRRTWLVAAAWLFPAMLWMYDLTAPGYVVAGALFAGYFGIAAALTPPGRARRFVLPGAMALAELARWTWPFGGVPLANLALSQVDTPLIYASRIAGSLLVIVLVIVVGQALHSLLCKDFNALGYAAAVVVLLVVCGYVYPRSQVVDDVEVALVQGGGPQRTRASALQNPVVLQRHLDASQEINDDVSLIIWPENVVNPNIYLSQQEAAQKIRQLAKEKDATVLPGWFYLTSPTEAVNYQAAVTPDGEQVDRYDKKNIVPFGEYVPLRSLAERFSDDLPAHDVVRGVVDPILDTPVGPVGVSISWEGYFDTRARSAVQHGAQILTNPTNGSSYWLTQVQSQQVAANKLHAVENDRWVLQVAPTGFSAIINPDGNVQQSAGISEQAVLQQSVEMRQGRTLASYVGFWPVGLYGIAAALAGLASQRRSRKHASSVSPAVVQDEPQKPSHSYISKSVS